MTKALSSTNGSSRTAGKSAVWLRVAIAAIAGCAFLLLFVVFNSEPRGLVCAVEIADGRIIVIEAVTYGTNHVVGHNSPLVERFGPWMPAFLRDVLSNKVPRSVIDRQQDSLVVWVHALSSAGKTNVDCQGIRVEFADENGDLWGASTTSWFGSPNFWRVGHVFEAYPRSAKKLSLRVTPWRTNVTASVTFDNPHPVTPAKWSGESSLPARLKLGGLEVVLERLILRTNRGKNWETTATFWEPEWRLMSDNQPVSGWREPEWTAMDPFGNRGQRLGIHQPILRWSATFVPTMTNLTAAEPIMLLPNSACSSTATNTVWCQTNSVHDAEVVAIGLFTATMSFFTDGQYDPKPPIAMGPTRGGAPTGWVGSSRRLNPMKVQTVRGHYSNRPVIYLQCRDFGLSERLGVRLRDHQGRHWATTREEQGNPDGIIPFMLDIPADVTIVAPEIVLLKSVHAEFTVRTRDATP